MCGAGDRDVKKEEDEVKHLWFGKGSWEEEAKHFLVFFASKNFKGTLSEYSCNPW